jgi:hypothetical protein
MVSKNEKLTIVMIGWSGAFPESNQPGKAPDILMFYSMT